VRLPPEWRNVNPLPEDPAVPGEQDGAAGTVQEKVEKINVIETEVDISAESVRDRIPSRDKPLDLRGRNHMGQI
jgi:hypothetical protein